MSFSPVCEFKDFANLSGAEYKTKLKSTLKKLNNPKHHSLENSVLLFLDLEHSFPDEETEMLLIFGKIKTWKKFIKSQLSKQPLQTLMARAYIDNSGKNPVLTLAPISGKGKMDNLLKISRAFKSLVGLSYEIALIEPIEEENADDEGDDEDFNPAVAQKEPATEETKELLAKEIAQAFKTWHAMPASPAKIDAGKQLLLKIAQAETDELILEKYQDDMDKIKGLMAKIEPSLKDLDLKKLQTELKAQNEEIDLKEPTNAEKQATSHQYDLELLILEVEARLSKATEENKTQLEELLKELKAADSSNLETWGQIIGKYPIEGLQKELQTQLETAKQSQKDAADAKQVQSLEQLAKTEPLEAKTIKEIEKKITQLSQAGLNAGLTRRLKSISLFVQKKQIAPIINDAKAGNYQDIAKNQASLDAINQLLTTLQAEPNAEGLRLDLLAAKELVQKPNSKKMLMDFATKAKEKLRASPFVPADMLSLMENLQKAADSGILHPEHLDECQKMMESSIKQTLEELLKNPNSNNPLVRQGLQTIQAKFSQSQKDLLQKGLDYDKDGAEFGAVEVPAAQRELLQKRQAIINNPNALELAAFGEDWQLKNQLLKNQATNPVGYSAELSAITDLKELMKEANLYFRDWEEKRILSATEWANLEYIRNVFIQSNTNVPNSNKQAVIDKINLFLLEKPKPNLGQLNEIIAHRTQQSTQIAQKTALSMKQVEEDDRAWLLPKAMYQRYEATFTLWEQFNKTPIPKHKDPAKLLEAHRLRLREQQRFAKKAEIMEFCLDVKDGLMKILEENAKDEADKKLLEDLNLGAANFARAMNVSIGGGKYNLLATSGAKGSSKAKRKDNNRSLQDLLKAPKGVGWPVQIKGINYILLDDIGSQTKGSPIEQALVDLPDLYLNHQDSERKIINVLDRNGAFAHVDSEMSPCDLCNHTFLLMNGTKTQGLCLVDYGVYYPDSRNTKFQPIAKDSIDFISVTDQLTKAHLLKI